MQAVQAAAAAQAAAQAQAAQAAQAQAQAQAAQAQAAPFMPGEVLRSSGKFGKPAKVPGRNFLKDEVIIRNADSGKGELVTNLNVSQDIDIHRIKQSDSNYVRYPNHVIAPLFGVTDYSVRKNICKRK